MPNSFTKPVSANDILSALGGIAVDLGTSSGSANALAGASTVDTGTTFTSGRLYRIRANAANTGAATCSINGGTGVALKKPPSSTALASGDIANATELLLFFDGTNLQVLSGLTVSATDSTKLPVDGSGAMTNRLKWSGTQTSSGNSDTNAWRSSDGTWNLNTPYGAGVNLTCNGVFYGAWNADGIYNSGYRGYILYADAGSANTALYQIILAGTKLVLHVPTGATHESQVNGVRVGGFPLTPSDMPYSQAGTTFTNDGNWYNFYSLAQGTHNGRFFISSALFAGFAILRIGGTSIDLVTDDWGFADITAASGKIAFRVSGGYLQINVGNGISSTPKKFSATFIGTVN